MQEVEVPEESTIKMWQEMWDSGEYTIAEPVLIRSIPDFDVMPFSGEFHRAPNDLLSISNQHGYRPSHRCYQHWNQRCCRSDRHRSCNWRVDTPINVWRATTLSTMTRMPQMMRTRNARGGNHCASRKQWCRSDRSCT